MSHYEHLVEVVRRNNFIIIDTETTGLDEQAQIVQIAAVDASGRVLIDSLVKPTCPIPPRVTDIHGIHDADVINAPSWGDLWRLVAAISAYRDVIAFNASFDIRMLRQSFEQNGDFEDWMAFERGMGEVVCAMRAYAEHWRAPSSRRRSFRWQSLGNACTQQGIRIENAHNALGDCLMTYALVKKSVPAA